jgi:phosphoglycerate dehydrogenase-like enzyme
LQIHIRQGKFEPYFGPSFHVMITNSTSFLVGITPDFETHARGVLEPAVTSILEPAGIGWEIMPDTGGCARAEVLDRYDAVIALDYCFPAESFAGLRRLAVLARWGVGYDRVDVAACTEAGVILAITRDSVRRPVAEGILALIFSLAKNLRTFDANCRAGTWRRNPPASIDLAGCTLGSVGMGSIAGEMFRLARAVGFGRLLAFSRSRTATAEEWDVEFVDLDRLLRESDFVAINCPLTPQTRGLIGARELALMKTTGYLINTARGAVVDEIALVDALRRKTIAGAGLDVFETEPLPAGHALVELDNVVLTPHMVAWTPACVRDTSLSACRSVLAVAHGKAPAYVANPAVLDHPAVRARLARRSSSA